MHEFKKGFTLSEVLITIAIIGVVAALTIPALISSTNSSKFITALKKNLLILNSSLTVNSAHNEMGADDTSIVTAANLANWFVTGNSAGTGTTRNLNTLKWAVDDTDVWLTDGTRLSFYKTTGVTGGCVSDTADAFTPTVAETCYVMLDTNGDRKPNSVATASTPADVYILGITPKSVIPVTLDAVSATLPTTDVNGGTLTPAYSPTTVASGNYASYAVMTGAT